MNDASTQAHGRTARAVALRARLTPRPGASNGPAAGIDGPARLVRAPGRVNLIGEYTDFNLGFVLPVAIDREVWIAYEPWDRPEVELTSVELNETRSFAFDGLAPRTTRTGSWIDYVAGTAWAMLGADLPVRGFRGVLDSTVPVGAGLSSSAALEMASSWALAVPDAARPGADKMAAIAQRAENGYVGVNCGIMDQFASAAGRAGHALLIDCRSITATATPLPPALSIVVCDTGAPRRLDSSAYNDAALGVRAGRAPDRGTRARRRVPARRRRGRCWRATATACPRSSGAVASTSSARTSGSWPPWPPCGIATWRRWGACSRRRTPRCENLFEVSSAELDTMVEIASDVPGVVASRMTGAGFGGCTVSLVERGSEEALRDAVLGEYPRRTGLTARVFPVAAVDGAGAFELP